MWYKETYIASCTNVFPTWRKERARLGRRIGGLVCNVEPAVYKYYLFYRLHRYTTNANAYNRKFQSFSTAIAFIDGFKNNCHWYHWQVLQSLSRNWQAEGEEITSHPVLHFCCLLLSLFLVKGCCFPLMVTCLLAALFAALFAAPSLCIH